MRFRGSPERLLRTVFKNCLIFYYQRSSDTGRKTFLKIWKILIKNQPRSATKWATCKISDFLHHCKIFITVFYILKYILCYYFLTGNTVLDFVSVLLKLLFNFYRVSFRPPQILIKSKKLTKLFVPLTNEYDSF